MRQVFGAVFATIGTVALTITLFGVGYFTCAFPITTMMLSQSVSLYETSPYTLDDLSTLAVASRDLTVEPRVAGDEAARTDFNQTLMYCASSSAERSESGYVNGIDTGNVSKRTMWRDLMTELGSNDPAVAFAMETADETASHMATYNDAFALDEAAFEHLDDCNRLIQDGTWLVKICAIIALVCLLLIFIVRRWHAAGAMLTVAPALIFVAFAGMGAWAFIDFPGFFSAFHGVFFPQGNWTFSSESLLISMYPSAFWMGMGILWLTTTLLASIITLFFGRKFAHIGR